MFLFAHHMAVEVLGREFSPHGTFQHVCVFGALSLLVGLSTYGAWTLAMKAADGLRSRRQI